MDTSVLSALRADAKGWWYHQQLRKDGNGGEAAQRERSSIRSSLRTLRSATSWHSNGDSTTTIHCGPNAYTVCGGYRNGSGLASVAAAKLPRCRPSGGSCR